ncbi:MAG: TonB-dependent receptor [Sphingomonadales bacterium]|nr:TonB-dependent receptor [Sphingomonadales bacterium]
MSSLALSLAIGCLPAAAQAQAAPEDDGQAKDEIVVTGTLLRGVAPVGSALTSVSQAKVVESGATTPNELLATVPQVTNFFNAVPATSLATAVNQMQVTRPNLRSLSSPSAATSATLVLVDGHRVAGIGVNQSTIDPELIPLGGIDHVEVVTDGGSATYGSDAVGGVINFITRKRFDGVKVDARYGFADNYYSFDAGATVGKDWGTGSLWAAYSYTRNDAIFGRDRSWIKGYDYSSATPSLKGRQCDAANVSLQGPFDFSTFSFPTVNYAYPNGAKGSFNGCDPTDNKTYVPAAERHGAIAGLYQDLSDSASINVKAFYSQRKTRTWDVLAANATITSANPNMFVPAGLARPASEVVNFNFGPALGYDSQKAGTDASEWGVNAELKVGLNDNWQLRTLFNYSRSNTSFFLNGVDATALTAAGASSTAATALNPFNIAATNPAVLAAITNWAIQGQARDELITGRAIIDGSLITLPGGDVRVAVGYEVLRDNFQQRYTSGAAIGALRGMPFSAYGRTIHSVFGELNIPVFGAGNATAGLQSLVISASGRYDHYSDVGGTFNPKIGVNYTPFDGLTLRGNWGTSFNAPAPLDQLGSARNSIGAFPFLPFIRPEDNGKIGFFGGYTIGLQGSNPGLKPQKADTWSVGADIAPPSIPGLRASITYYNVTFKDLLGTPTPDAGIFANFPANATTNLTGLSPAVVRAFAAQDPNGLAVVNPVIASGGLIYALIDFRVGNYGILKASGLDFSTSYVHETGFGSVDLAVAGNYQLTRKTQSSAAAPVRDQLVAITAIQQNATPRLQLQTSLGTTIGNLRAQATLNHSSGFAIARTAVRPQDKVGSFNTVNLFFKYDVPAESGMLKNLSFSANINNVFDQAPPAYLSTPDDGYANGFTLGRLFMIGVSKKF